MLKPWAITGIYTTEHVEQPDLIQEVVQIPITDIVISTWLAIWTITK